MTKIGRPLKYSTPELMEAAIEKYFTEDCPKRRMWSNGVPYTIEVPTISGLALYLGFMDRQSMYDYEKQEAFSSTIKTARARITMHFEANAQLPGAAGSIFMLKNLGYTDKSELDLNANLTTMDKILKDGKIMEFDIGEKDPDNQ